MRLFLASMLLGLPTAFLLFHHDGQEMDRRLVARARAAAVASAPLDRFMQLGTVLGARDPILFALLAPAAFGAQAARVTAGLAFLSVSANQLATVGLKYASNRPRPDGDASRSNSSFPSAHASAAAGLAWIVSSRHRRLAPWMILLALWISSSRVFLERHYVSDILAGALLGILFAALALVWQDRLSEWVRSR